MNKKYRAAYEKFIPKIKEYIDNLSSDDNDKEDKEFEINEVPGWGNFEGLDTSDEMKGACISFGRQFSKDVLDGKFNDENIEVIENNKEYTQGKKSDNHKAYEIKIKNKKA